MDSTPATVPAPPLFERTRASLGVFLLFFVVWTGANLPGLVSPWWQTDDFAFADQCNPAQGLLHVAAKAWRLYANDGRPFALPVAYLFALDQPPTAWSNLLAHWLQATLHVLGAFVLYRILARYAKPWQAALAAAPFLLWGFNGECVLWTNSFQYVWGYLVAIFGIREFLIGSETGNGRRLALGTALVGMGVLTQQSPSGTPLMVWLIAAALRSLGASPLDAARQKKLFAKELLLLCGAMFAACVVAWLLGKFNGGSRTHVSLHPGQRFYYLRVLDSLFLFWPKPYPDFYPFLVKVLHGLLLAVPLALAARHFAKDRRAALLCFLAVGAALVLPYWAHMLVDTFSPSFRVFYVAPLLFAAAILIGFALARRGWLRAILAAAVVLLAWEYAGIARANSREYVALYDKQVNIIRGAEVLARANHCDTLAIDAPRLDELGNMNPFGLRYFFWDSRQSSLHFYYTAERFLRSHTTMKVLTRGETARYEEAIRAVPSREAVRYQSFDGVVVIVTR